jgi:carotenoid cleavage dioxygenase-like enzyme
LIIDTWGVWAGWQLGKVVESGPLATLPSEFPCVNPNWLGQPTRFGYTAGIRQGVAAGSITLFDAVVKHDLSDGCVSTLSRFLYGCHSMLREVIDKSGKCGLRPLPGHFYSV